MSAHSAAHWLLRAEEARTLADQMHDPATRRTMLSIAASYEKLARHAALAGETAARIEREQAAED
jgi:hypothetical protein